MFYVLTTGWTYGLSDGRTAPYHNTIIQDPSKDRRVKIRSSGRICHWKCSGNLTIRNRLCRSGHGAQQATSQYPNKWKPSNLIYVCLTEPHIEAETKWQKTFCHAFSWMKMCEISIKISLKFVPKGPIDNMLSLVQMMAWRWPGHKRLSEPMMVSLLTHICVNRPQWV